MSGFALLFADPSLGLFFHHGNSRAIHEHIENRNRLPHDHRQVQLHGVLDGRLVLDRHRVSRAGFKYVGLAC